MLQVLPSKQYICSQKTSDSKMVAPNFFLAPDAIQPRYAPGAQRVEPAERGRNAARVNI